MSLYYPGCVQMPGPTHKVWPEENSCDGVILHSAEGYRAGLESQLRDAEVSWHFTVYQDGTVEQHYPLTASCWHAGSKASNVRLIGVEHEGVAGEPLTAAQLLASVALVRWLQSECGWGQLARGVNLYEHREVNSGTNCPSGRIPWERYTAPADRFTKDDAITLFRYAIGGNGIAPGVTVTALPRSPQGNRVFNVEMP